MIDSLEYVGKTIKVIIDRPLRSKHPKHNIYYSVNYGYVPGTKAADGEPFDAYILGVSEPVKEFTGRCIAVIHRINDNDDKLVVAPEGLDFTDDQIRALTKFQERFFKSRIVRSSI